MLGAVHSDESDRPLPWRARSSGGDWHPAWHSTEAHLKLELKGRVREGADSSSGGNSLWQGQKRKQVCSANSETSSLTWAPGVYLSAVLRHRRLKGRDGARLLRSSESLSHVEHGLLKRETDFIKSTFYREYSNRSSMGAELKWGELDSRIVREKTNCQPGCTAIWEKRAKCSVSPWMAFSVWSGGFPVPPSGPAATPSRLHQLYDSTISLHWWGFTWVNFMNTVDRKLCKLKRCTRLLRCPETDWQAPPSRFLLAL